MKVTFYFVRHGETLFNRKGRIQGVCDSPLTGNGIKQAEKAGEALKEIYFDRAYVSPSERAMDTAELILNGRKTEAEITDGLHEFDFGRFEGTRFTSHPDEIRRCFDLRDFSSVEGETEADAAARIRETLDRITAGCEDGDRVLLVSHGMLEMIAAKSLMGVDLNEVQKKKTASGKDVIPNGGIMVFTWEDGVYTLVSAPAEPGKFKAPEEDKTVHFVYVRHGETSFNMWNRMQGACDSPLTSHGIAQAKMAADALRHIHFDRIYTSTSKRTRDTAEMIAAPHHIRPILEKGLKEVSFGDFDGIVRDSWQKEIGRRHETETWGDVGGEDKEEVRERIFATMNKIITRAKNDETILLVSHGTYYLNMLEELFGMNRKTYFENAMKEGRQAMPNGGIFEFDYVNGKYEIITPMTSPEDFDIRKGNK